MTTTGPVSPAVEAGPVHDPSAQDDRVLTAAAEAAVLRSGIDPHQALDAGRAVLAAAERAGAVEPAMVALRAMALAARELGDLQAAERYLRRAIASPGAPRDRLAQARLSLVTVRTERGHPLQALRVAALAWSYLSPVDRAKLDTQRAVALAHLGRYQEAMACCDRSLRILSAASGTIDDRKFLAGGLLNRGLVHAYQGEWDLAMRDIVACLDLSHQAGLDHLGRLATANLPFLAVRQGDIGGAFDHYRRSEDALFGFPERLATMRADFAGALLAAHLPGEARALLSVAVPELEASGANVALAEARLRHAQVELLTGDARLAIEVALRAKAELAAQGREAWLPLATEVILRARLALGGPSNELLAELLDCADELDFGPSLGEAAAALRLVCAEVALALGDRETATTELCLLTTLVRPCQSAPPGTRLTRLASEQQASYLAGERSGPSFKLIRQHAMAIDAAMQGDPAVAFRAALEGLAVVGARAAVLADPSVRAHAARAGDGLAAFGLGLAVSGGGAMQVFDWAERWRSVTAGGPATSPELGAVRAALGGAALVEFVLDGPDLLAVVISGDDVALRRVCLAGAAGEAVIRLRYALRRAALRDTAVPGGAVDAQAAELERLLLDPLTDVLDGRPLVLVPAGPLHTLPWSALPRLRGCPVSVAASAAAWHRAGDRAALTAAPLVGAAAGPSLDHAHDEVGRVLAAHHRPELVRGRTADVLAALDRVDVFHLAAHGVFHARSPLLSSITLEDGPLMAHDLLGLARPARLVVLSACDSGMARVPAEGAPLGLAGAFLTAGASCVVAGLIPVPDAETVALMSTFHELVAAGQPPATALAAATAETGVLGFVCFGAGDQPIAAG